MLNGKYAAAIECFNLGIKLNPTHIQSYLAKGQA